ncbi:D-Tyr-tRNA(Tyr) deacylase, partial [Opisthorchis viverrini]
LSTVRAILISIFCTFFPFLDLPVFWPILVLYFIMLFTLMMKRQIKHMIKYRYVPFSYGKPKHTGNNNKETGPPSDCCTSAELLVEHGCSDKVNIGKGLIVYVAFLNECPDSKLSKIADTICSVKLIANDDGILQSVVDHPCDLLIVPQYCLGGKLKGKCFQYHGALDKQKSETLYSSLVALCKNDLLRHLGLTFRTAHLSPAGSSDG